MPGIHLGTVENIEIQTEVGTRFSPMPSFRVMWIQLRM
jgi:hypothetical protein